LNYRGGASGEKGLNFINGQNRRNRSSRIANRHRLAGDARRALLIAGCAALVRVLRLPAHGTIRPATAAMSHRAFDIRRANCRRAFQKWTAARQHDEEDGRRNDVAQASHNRFHPKPRISPGQGLSREGNRLSTPISSNLPVFGSIRAVPLFEPGGFSPTNATG
jgi:hypothetical protein